MEFRILGPLEVMEKGRAVAVRGARERALLVYLLLHANRTVAADRLIDELWGENPPARARKSLQVRVAGLRRIVGHERLVSRSPGYVLLVETGELDLARFEELVAGADEAAPAEAAELLRSALDLWRGSPLADVSYESFAQPAIQRLEEIRLVALERRIDADLTLGREADLIPELQALVSEHPLRERFRAQLMLALYRCERQAEALEQYREARRVLVEGLGVEPGHALRDLEQAILRHDPSLVGRAPESDRSLLVFVHDEPRLPGLVALAGTLASRPRREVILTCPVHSAERLASASGHLNERRKALLAVGVSARAAAFTSTEPAADVLRMAAELDVDLLLVDAPEALLEDELLGQLLERAPCDVAAFVPGEQSDGPVLVPFSGAEHDWAAIEIAAWAARARGVVIRLAGPTVDPTGRGRDASRLLASASLAVQRSLAVDTEPVLVSPEPDTILDAAEGVGLVVLGLSDRWRTEGLGTARTALAEGARSSVLIVRRGLRPGGLAPAHSLTRFTWTVMPWGT
jgi:DNA-binding SARP family transcriptional activator